MKRTAAENNVLAAKIVELFENTTLTMTQISDQVGVSWPFVSKTVKNEFTAEYRKERKAGCYRASKLGDKNPMTGKFREAHHNYIGVVSDGKGYLMVLRPDWYTGRLGSKHIFQHHVEYCLAHGLTAIPKGYVIHHKDQVKTNNEPNNLLLLTMADHARLHSRLKRAETISKESRFQVESKHTIPSLG